MELILISEEKLKIILTKEDMDAYSLRGEEADYDDTHTRRALWSILDDAKKQSGFDAAASRVCLQLFPSRTGGCELYVTRLRADGKSEITLDPEPQGEALLSFPSLDPMLSLCAALAGGRYDGQSEAYLCPDGSAALLLSGPLPPLLAEYAPRRGELYRAYVREHGTLLCTDAVGRLSQIENAL